MRYIPLDGWAVCFKNFTSFFWMGLDQRKSVKEVILEGKRKVNLLFFCIRRGKDGGESGQSKYGSFAFVVFLEGAKIKIVFRGKRG